MKALLVGINNYYKREWKLRGCLNDVQSMENTLRYHGCHDITRLTDRQATSHNIMTHLQNMSTRHGDHILFYYSGHGSQVRDRNRDESDRKDEILCSVDIHKGSYVSDDMIYQWITGNHPSIRTTLIYDCCNSGTGNRSLRGHPRFIDVDIKQESRNIPMSRAIPKNHVFMSACQSYQLANEVSVKGQTKGIFTTLFTTLAMNTQQESYMSASKIIDTICDLFNYDQTPYVDGDRQHEEIFAL